MSQEYPDEYLDPLYWHPKCKNFEIIDWEKWERLNPKASIKSVFNPPQRQMYSGAKRLLLWWTHRSCICQPLPWFIQACCGPKSERENISAGSTLVDMMLKPHPEPDLVPEPLRNKLLWTENNIAAETLVSFNRYAWRKQTSEGRVVGLGKVDYDWSMDPTALGIVVAFRLINKFATFQISPDGKWICIALFDDPTENGTCNYIYMYIVQEGETFVDWHGNPMDHVKPGDIIRLTWDVANPYECRPDKLKYMYFPRVVAELNKVEEVVKHEENYAVMEGKATASEPCCSTCCYLCGCFMCSAEERFDYQTKYISDCQTFSTSPTPPSSHKIDRL